MAFHLVAPPPKSSEWISAHNALGDASLAMLLLMQAHAVAHVRVAEDVRDQHAGEDGVHVVVVVHQMRRAAPEGRHGSHPRAHWAPM